MAEARKRAHVLEHRLSKVGGLWQAGTTGDKGRGLQKIISGDVLRFEVQALRFDAVSSAAEGSRFARRGWLGIRARAIAALCRAGEEAAPRCDQGRDEADIDPMAHEAEAPKLRARRIDLRSDMIPPRVAQIKEREVNRGITRRL